MSKSEFPRGLMVVARALFFVRVILPLVMVPLFVATCVANRRDAAVAKAVESAGRGMVVTKGTSGPAAGEYHIGTALYLAPDVHFEVLTRVANRTRVYHWSARLGEGVAAGDALTAAMQQSMRDSAEKARSEVGRMVLWSASDASQWADSLSLPVLASQPRLVAILQ